MAREWPLVVFTVTGQMAVGVFLFVVLPLYFHLDSTAGGAGSEIRPAALLGSLGLLVAGLLASFFHLGRPFRAFRAVSNVRTSWLSREILFEIVFLALLAALAAGEGLGAADGGSLFRITAAAAGLAGLLYLFSMTRIYTLPAVPEWGRLSTPLAFFLTVLVTGSLAASLLFSLRPDSASSWRPHGRVSLLLLVLGLGAALLFSPRYGLLEGKEGPSLKPPATAHVSLHVIRLVLMAVGTGLLAAGLALTDDMPAAGLPVSAFLTAAFLSVCAAEVLGRFLFYGIACRQQ